MSTQEIQLTAQERRVFNALRLDPLTPLKAWSMYGIMRLSAVIFNLKSKGFTILSERVTVRNRYGESCPIAKYTLVSYPDNVASEEPKNFGSLRSRLTRAYGGVE
jgi:hypothetical protein